MTYYQYWAKTDIQWEGSKPEPMNPSEYHLLPYHLLDVSAACVALLETNPIWRDKLGSYLSLSPQGLSNTIAFLYALHDIGKFGDGFQHMAPWVLESFGKSYKPHNPMTPRHDVTGHMFLLGDFPKSTQYPLYEVFLDVMLEKEWLITDAVMGLESLLVSVTGHHGYPTPYHRSKRKRRHYEGKNTLLLRQVQREFSFETYEDILSFLEDVHTLFQPSTLHLDYMTTRTLADLTWILAGFGTLADWVGSSKEYFPYHKNEMPLDVYWNEHALPQARHAVVQTKLAQESFAPTSYFEGLVETPRPLQSKMQETDPEHLFMLIEDMSGSGKTEAALAKAREWIQRGAASGLYFALPTRVSAKGIFERLSSYMKSMGIDFYTLNYQDSLQSELYEGFLENLPEGSTPPWMSDSRKKAILAQVGVGTIDQALVATLPHFHSNLRLASLAQKVFIVDEVHAYDDYQLELLESLLTFLGKVGAPVILMSATLPKRIKVKLLEAYNIRMPQKKEPRDAYPLITTGAYRGHRIDELPVTAAIHRTYPIEVIPARMKKMQFDRVWSPAEHDAASKILQASREGAAVVWYRNSVKDALLAYKEISKLATDVHLIHSRYTREDRDAKDTWLLRTFGKKADDVRRGKIVITTQVLQESLDVDFDMAVSDLAPIDVLLQRFGRVYRHASKTRIWKEPKLYVISPPLISDPDPSWIKREALGSTSWIYANQTLLWKTAQVLQRSVWNLPDDMRGLIEHCYDPSYPSGLENNALHREGVCYAHKGAAWNKRLQLDKPYGDDEGSLIWYREEVSPTRLSEPSKTWVCVYEHNGEPLGSSYEASKIAISYSLLEIPFKVNSQYEHYLLFSPEGVVTGVNDRGAQVVLQYSKEEGLQPYQPTN